MKLPRFHLPFSILLLAAACGGGTSSATNDAGGSGGHEGGAGSDASGSGGSHGDGSVADGSGNGSSSGSDGSGGGSDAAGDGGAGGDGSCVHDSGAPTGGDGAADGGCSGPGTPDCYTCCQDSYPKGYAAYENAYHDCACSLCAGPCPVSCGCGTLQDDSCTNCINGYKSNDAGCFSTLDPTCQSDPDCSAFLSCVNGICQFNL
jgi:hypothetical protein